MTVPAETKKRYTIEEYLVLERAALEKHEFHDGEILAMSGGSFFHSMIISNVVREVGNGLKGKPCAMLEANLRVRVMGLNRFVYPDGTIVCGSPKFDPSDGRRETILNPTVVFEVLSPSTEGYDRGDKFAAYQSIDSLREYVLVSQSQPRIESFIRQADDSWMLKIFSGITGALLLRSMDLQIPLSEIFSRVEFPDASASNPST